MNLRRPLIVLVYGLVVLVVTFAVLSGASQLSAAIGDGDGAALLGRIAIGSLILLVIDVLLLVGLMGVRTLDDVDSLDQASKTKADMSRNEDTVTGDSG